jgi:hypothetical protein
MSIRAYDGDNGDDDDYDYNRDGDYNGDDDDSDDDDDSNDDEDGGDGDGNDDDGDDYDDISKQTVQFLLLHLFDSNRTSISRTISLCIQRTIQTSKASVKA